MLVIKDLEFLVYKTMGINESLVENVRNGLELHRGGSGGTRKFFYPEAQGRDHCREKRVECCQEII